MDDRILKLFLNVSITKNPNFDTSTFLENDLNIKTLRHWTVKYMSRSNTDNLYQQVMLKSKYLPSTILAIPSFIFASVIAVD